MTTRGILALALAISSCSSLSSSSSTPDPPCRDRVKAPFSSSSIWNVAIGSEAVFTPANLYPKPSPSPSPSPSPPTDVCEAGRLHPARRAGCPGWESSWTPATCLAHGCCYDPHPSPDPLHYAWCYANVSGPSRFYVDIDYMIVASASDPETPFLDQGWWGVDSECGRDHCCRKSTTKQVGTVPFPRDWVVNMTSNNAAALLLPDNVTLVQFQPLVRCTPGSPLFSLPSWQRDTHVIDGGGGGGGGGGRRVPVPGWTNFSILGDGLWGAHGGSRLSSIGGTVRLGELLPDAPPIAHALKLMLFAQDYYWPGNASTACYRWPALNCDGSWNASRVVTNPNFYNGTNPKLKPGALLAVPAAAAARLRMVRRDGSNARNERNERNEPIIGKRGGIVTPRHDASSSAARADGRAGGGGGGSMRTAIGSKILQALTDYGGYLDDNTASNSGAFNVEGGVIEEVASAYGGDGDIDLRTMYPGKPLYDDLLDIYRELHIVDNNGPGTRTGGGGVPRRPPRPPICGAAGV